ncbi:hypothetical protein [Streptomyces chryseus]
MERQRSGKVSPARRPLVGREMVVRFLVGVTQRFGCGREVAEVNGAPALVVHPAGQLITATSFDLMNGVITQFQVAVNPDKSACSGE